MDTIKRARTAIALLVVSASTLVGIATHEGYKDEAYIPVPGDVPTIDFGRTKGVKMGDKSNPVRGLQYLMNDLENVYAAGIKKCIKVPLFPWEFSALMKLSYNVGVGAVCQTADKSKNESDRLIDVLNKGNYEEACRRILSFNKFQGKVLRGLTKRREADYRECRGWT